jgi:hypothetical protein
MRALVVATLLVAAPVWASTFSYGGALGGGFSQADAWSGSGHQGVTTWDLDADFSMGGQPFRPGLLAFLAEGHYLTLRTYYFNSHSQADNLGFNVSASAFATSPIMLSLGAAKNWSEFVTDGAAHTTGATQTTNLNASALFRLPNYPTLRVSVFQTELDNHSLGGNSTSAATTQLSVGAAYSVKNQDYDLGYNTSWNNGTLAQTNYQAHDLTFNARVAASDTLMLRLAERYYLRLPTTSDPTNPRYDDNSVSVGAQWRPNLRVQAALDYDYRHLLVEAASSPRLEELANGLSQTTYYALTPGLNLQTSLGYIDTTERLGGSTLRGDGQNAGAGLSWRRILNRTLQMTLSGSGSVAIAEPVGMRTLFGYSLSGGGGLTYAQGPVRSSATYTGSYQRNNGGLPGASLTQSANLSGEAMIRQVVSRAMLTLNSSRRDDPLLGTFLGRSATLTLFAAWRIYNAQFTGGLTDGLSAALQNPGVTDGLFLPAAYNTHSAYATLSSSLVLDHGHLTLTGMAREMVTTAPDRPETYEHGLSFTTTYTLGLFTFMAEERISRGGTGSIDQTANLIFFRVTRIFGGTF